MPTSDARPQVFVQMSEVWGVPDPRIHFREGFRDFVGRVGRPDRDHVLILEPNPSRGGYLRGLWSGWPNAVILEMEVGHSEESVRSYYFAEESPSDPDYFAPRADAIHRRFPDAPIGQVAVLVEPLARILQRLAPGCPIGLLSIDLRGGLRAGERGIDWMSPHMEAVSFTFAGVDQEDVVSIDHRVRAAGYRRAGRAWGEAGSGRLYRRPRSLGVAFEAAAAEAKVVSGEWAVAVRDGWMSRDSRQSLLLRSRVLLSPSLSRQDVLDDRFGRELPAISSVRVSDLVRVERGDFGPPFSVTLDEPDPVEVGMECARRHGVWPVSFSYPDAPLPLLESPGRLVSAITPGLPYSFEDADAYLANYQNAYFGLTHRKAGWDCFRHLEISAAGAVPLMPDARDIPGYSMVHYPKRAMAAVARLVATTGSPPSAATRQAFRDHFLQHLTSKAMAQYLLRVSRLEGAQRVLFVDASLPQQADYLSAMTLIGMKQLLGSGCHVLFPSDYIYTDTATLTSSLYGRGFGYTRIVSPEARSATELGSPADIGSFDAVVLGSVTRNSALASELLGRFPSSRTIWLHGEDTPPGPQAVRELRASGAHVFVRAIHTGR